MNKKKSYDYPKKYDDHMISVRHRKDLPVLDANFPYRNLSFKGKSTRFLTYLGCYIVAFPLMWLFTGLKIKGRKNLKKHKAVLKNGGITICNHVHMWDTICLHKAIRPIKTFQPAWAVNFTGPNRFLIRGIGGMPIPSNISGLKSLLKTKDQILKEGKWLHFFPEVSMWFYYEAIRPFKKGAFSFAVKHNKPILPICINYRKAKGFRKIFRRGSPYFLTINIGELIFPNQDLAKREAIEDLLNKSRSVMQAMSEFEEIIPQERIHRGD